MEYRQPENEDNGWGDYEYEGRPATYHFGERGRRLLEAERELLAMQYEEMTGHEAGCCCEECRPDIWAV